MSYSVSTMSGTLSVMNYGGSNTFVATSNGYGGISITPESNHDISIMNGNGMVSVMNHAGSNTFTTTSNDDGRITIICDLATREKSTSCDTVMKEFTEINSHLNQENKLSIEQLLDSSIQPFPCFICQEPTTNFDENVQPTEQICLICKRQNNLKKYGQCDECHVTLDSNLYCWKGGKPERYEKHCYQCHMDVWTKSGGWPP